MFFVGLGVLTLGFCRYCGIELQIAASAMLVPVYERCEEDAILGYALDSLCFAGVQNFLVDCNDHYSSQGFATR